MVCIVLDDNQYKEICVNYILNFINEKSEVDSIRKIGLLIIDLNTNKDIIRKKIYLKHFKNFYLFMILYEISFSEFILKIVLNVYIKIEKCFIII